MSDGEASSDESNDESTHDRSEENDGSDTTGKTDLLTSLDFIADS